MDKKRTALGVIVFFVMSLYMFLNGWIVKDSTPLILPVFTSLIIVFYEEIFMPKRGGSKKAVLEKVSICKKRARNSPDWAEYCDELNDIPEDAYKSSSENNLTHTFVFEWKGRRRILIIDGSSNPRRQSVLHYSVLSEWHDYGKDIERIIRKVVEKKEKDLYEMADIAADLGTGAQEKFIEYAVAPKKEEV